MDSYKCGGESQCIPSDSPAELCQNSLEMAVLVRQRPSLDALKLEKWKFWPEHDGRTGKARGGSQGTPLWEASAVKTPCNLV